MWGALAGAIVGAAAAYLFSLDLSRRAHQAAYQLRMDAIVARIVQELQELIATPDTVPKEIRKRRRRQGWNVESDRLLFLADEALLVARGNDLRVVAAIQNRFLSWVELRGEHLDYQLIGDYSPLLESAQATIRDLAAWRRGDIEVDEIARRMKKDYSPIPRSAGAK